MTAGECRASADWNVPLPIRLTLAAAVLCNDAVLQAETGRGCFTASGDPAEGALLVAAVRIGVSPDRLQAAAPRLAEAPFDSNRQRMTTVRRLAGELPDALQPFERTAVAVARDLGMADRPEAVTGEALNRMGPSDLAAIYLPFLDRFFGLTPLALPDLALAAAMGALTWVGVQVEKRLSRGRPRSGPVS